MNKQEMSVTLTKKKKKQKSRNEVKLQTKNRKENKIDIHQNTNKGMPSIFCHCWCNIFIGLLSKNIAPKSTLNDAVSSVCSVSVTEEKEEKTKANNQNKNILDSCLLCVKLC